jgi:hypothetical protein
MMGWSASVGPMTSAMVQRIVDSDAIREHGWRRTMPLRRLGEKYGLDRLERACSLAVAHGARSYKPVERLLRLGRENAPLPTQDDRDALVIEHENVRGPDYFAN